MAEYILRILRSRIFVMMSWGFHNPVAIKNGLRFNVQGFLLTGIVEVIYIKGIDLFEVRTLSDDGTIKQVVDGVYIDSLVNVIDGLVERCEEYENAVNREYNL